MTSVPSMMFCCDPGLASGVAILSYKDAQLQRVMSMECEMAFVGEAAEQFLVANGPRDAEVVCERFTITPKTARNSQAPWSLETIGMLKWLIWRHWQADYEHLQVNYEDRLVLQQPGDAMGLVSNEMLRKLGLWHRGGEGHANDALKHGVYRYARLGIRDTLI